MNGFSIWGVLSGGLQEKRKTTMMENQCDKQVFHGLQILLLIRVRHSLYQGNAAKVLKHFLFRRIPKYFYKKKTTQRMAFTFCLQVLA
jgi:hypothetical protein